MSDKTKCINIKISEKELEESNMRAAAVGTYMLSVIQRKRMVSLMNLLRNNVDVKNCS